MKTLIEMVNEVYGEFTFWTEPQLMRLKELEKLVRADEREKAEERVTKLYEDMEDPYLPDIIKVIRRADR